MSFAATVPAAVLAAYPDQISHPTIVEVFHPQTGWNTLRGRPLEIDRLVSGSYRKRITPAYARKLRGQGVTVVALSLDGGRVADFTAAELARKR